MCYTYSIFISLKRILFIAFIVTAIIDFLHILCYNPIIKYGGEIEMSAENYIDLYAESPSELMNLCISCTHQVRIKLPKKDVFSTIISKYLFIQKVNLRYNGTRRIMTFVLIIPFLSGIFQILTAIPTTNSFT